MPTPAPVADRLDAPPGARSTGVERSADEAFDRSPLVGLGLDESAAVFGAPGSGKTTLAVELVARRIERDCFDADEVLALAATRSTASRLRDRIAVRLGSTTRGPLARTANSLAFQLVRAYTGRPVTLLTGAEHDQIIAELLEAAELDGGGADWPFETQVRSLRGFRSELRDLLMRAAEHDVDAEALVRLGRAAGRDEWVSAGRFLAEYVEVKDQLRGGQFDSSELAAFAAAVVARSAVDDEASAALGPLRRLRLVVVDDAQETTAATASLIAAFAARGVHVVAFGDPDVASNGFRGGRPELLGALPTLLGHPARRLELPAVHRGRPELRAVVAGVTGHIGAALGGSHRNAGYESPEAPAGSSPDDAVPAIVGIEAPSHAAECREVASLLRERHLLDGVPWSQMAVVLRSGADAPSFERGLALADVPTAGALARTVLREAPAGAALLRAASYVLDREPLTPELAVTLATGPLGRFDGVGLRRLRLALRHEELAAGGDRTGDELLVDALAAPGGFATIDAAVGRKAARLAKLLAAARRTAEQGGTIEEVLWSLWEGSGLANEWGAQAQGTGVLAEEANRALDVAVALFAAAQRYVERTPGAPAVRFVDEQLSSELPEDSLAPQRAAETVFVGTAPALIGREFEVVVIAGLQEGVWPNLRPRGTLLHAALLPSAVTAAREGRTPPEPETAAEARVSVRSDELRLFALAASRARRQLVLSCTANDDEQPSMLMGYAEHRVRGQRRRPMQLRGLVGALRREAVADAGGEAPSALALLAEAGIPGAHPEEWYGMRPPSTVAALVDLAADPEAVVHVSPSQIDRAEESPLGWFVDRVAAPPSGLAASIGTIVHAVVEEAGATGETALETIWAGVETRLAELRFEAGWVAEREKRGARRMAEGAAGYLENFADDAKVLLGAEGRFTLELGRVRLTGTIDRVEASPDGTTVIVDLKTGRTPPSAAETAAHPQLAAYQLAARHGAVPNRGALGGAKLVYLARPLRGAPYTERAQQPFDDDDERAFRERLDAVAAAMSGSTFEAPVEIGHRSRFGAWHYRVHLVPAVSA